MQQGAEAVMGLPGGEYKNAEAGLKPVSAFFLKLLRRRTYQPDGLNRKPFYSITRFAIKTSSMPAMIAAIPNTLRVAVGSCGILESTSFIFAGAMKYGSPSTISTSPTTHRK